MKRLLLASLAFLLPIAAAVTIIVIAAGPSSSGVDVAGRTHEFVIPEGTADRMKKGLLTEDILPEQYSIAHGDTIVVTNLDVVVHSFGPFTVRSGESQRMRFDEPGFYFGVCTVGDHETVTITVT